MAINLKRDGLVGVITMDAPPVNSYDVPMLHELQKAIHEARLDDGIRAIIIKSALPKFFSAGADIKTLQNSTPAEFATLLTIAHETMDMLENTPKLVIAAISGHALGGGLEMTLACDFRFARDAKFQLGLVEINLGLNPAMGGTQRLPRIISSSLALHMIATGETIDPATAHTRGIVDRLIPEDNFDDEVMAYASKLAEGPTLAQGMAKLSINKGTEASLAEGLAIERSHQNILFKSDDAAEGVNAFVEKRKPEFKGR
jgi:enoyl-CoA hydratase/carnithine racemase